MNYETNVILYKVDFLNKELPLKKIAVRDYRRLGELVQITDLDTVVMEDDNSNEIDLEMDENEENQEKTKIELKKSDILSKQQSTTSKSIIYLQWAVYLILTIHFSIAIYYYVTCYGFVQNSSILIDLYSNLFTQLNFTLSSTNSLLEIIYINNPLFNMYGDKLGLISTHLDILHFNSEKLYSLNHNISSSDIYINNNFWSYTSQNVNFNYFSSPGVISSVSMTFLEGLLEVSLSLTS